MYHIVRPTKAHTKEMLSWKYDGIYSFYDNDKTEAKAEWVATMDQDECSYVIRDDKDNLVANCSFEYDEDEKVYEFGIQMKPSLTGRGLGFEVVNAALEFGRKKYKFDEVVLLVCDFNKRAMKLYENLGFETFEEFDTISNNQEVHFLVMKKHF